MKKRRRLRTSHERSRELTTEINLSLWTYALHAISSLFTLHRGPSATLGKRLDTSPLAIDYAAVQMLPSSIAKALASTLLHVDGTHVSEAERHDATAKAKPLLLRHQSAHQAYARRSPQTPKREIHGAEA